MSVGDRNPLPVPVGTWVGERFAKRFPTGSSSDFDRLRLSDVEGRSLNSKVILRPSSCVRIWIDGVRFCTAGQSGFFGTRWPATETYYSSGCELFLLF
jgi:hypothetical protein